MDEDKITPEEAAAQLAVHRYLVTADEETAVIMGSRTGPYANWIERRGGRNGTTWLVAVFDGDSGAFLDVTSQCGAVVQEIHSGWGIIGQKPSGTRALGPGESYTQVLGGPPAGARVAEDDTGVRFSFRLPAAVFGEFAKIAPDAIRSRPGEPIFLGVTGEPVDSIAFVLDDQEAEAQFESAVVDPGGEAVVINLRLPTWDPPFSPGRRIAGTGLSAAPAAGPGDRAEPQEDPSYD